MFIDAELSQEYPIKKSDMSIEYLRDHCHLRARTEDVAATLRLRDSTLRTLQNYFTVRLGLLSCFASVPEAHENQNLGFCYSHTPIVVSSDCEGAGETFRIAPPSADEASESPKQGASHSSQAPAEIPKPPPEFFGRPAYLTVSSQLHLEALATSLSRVYTISPCFRAERSQTGRHLSEFWMLEAEWAFTNKVDDVCQVVEDAVKGALEQTTPDLSLLRSRLPEDRLRGFEKAAKTAWARVSYTDAVKELQQAHAGSKPFKFAPEWGKPLRSEHERWIAEQLVRGPTFVTDYPTHLKPFYMRMNDDERTVACFDLLVPHLGELVGGSLREERMSYLHAAMDKHNLDEADYGWYLDLRKYGGAPHGGFGLGFERLISWISGVENVRECIPMPRWAGRMLL